MRQEHLMPPCLGITPEFQVSGYPDYETYQTQTNKNVIGNED